MKTILATTLVTMLLTTFSIPAGEPGEAPVTYTIKDDVVYSPDRTPVESAMQIIQGNAGEVTTATCEVYFVVGEDSTPTDEKLETPDETTIIADSPNDGTMQTIHGNTGEVTTATCVVTFVKE